MAAGAAGAALLSARGAGLIRTTVPRTADHVYYVGGRDLSWLVSGSMSTFLPPDQAATVRSAGAFLAMCERQGCTETQLTPPLDATMEVGGDGASRPLVVYTNWSTTTGAYRFFDGPTGEPISTEIQPRTTSSASKVVDPYHGWTLITDASPGIQVRDLHDGHQIAQIPVTPEENDMRATELPGGSAVLLVNAPTGTSYLLDTTTWTLRPAPFRKGDVIWAVFSGDGSTLATAASNGEITIRDGHTFEVLRRLGVTDELSPWLPMAFSDDARFLVTVHPAGGRLWDVGTGSLIGQLVPTLPTTGPASVPGPSRRVWSRPASGGSSCGTSMSTGGRPSPVAPPAAT